VNKVNQASLTAPLAVPAFRSLWSASIVSNIGAMMQAVGAAWLMTSLTESTLLVGLVQTAATMPVFLVGLVGGAMADLADRKKLLFWSQVWMLVMAALLGILTLGHFTTPAVLLGLTFAIGLGRAIGLPAWQASVQDIVPKPLVASAVSLNSIAFNAARAVGPALGGLLVAATGAAFAFFANAASFLAVLFAVNAWKPEKAPAPRLGEDIFGAIRSGFRYLLHAPRLQAPIIRATMFGLCAAAVWSLLPLLARDVLHTNATGYGVLLGAFGAGSIVAGTFLPRLRNRFALEGILALGTALAAVAFFALSFCRQPWPAGVSLFFAGMAWVGVLVNFNVAVQTSVPDWVRGRALAFYLLAFQGALAISGALWGWLAGVIGISQSFAVAAVGLILSLAFSKFFPLESDEEIDLSPSPAWPELHADLVADPDDGPVLVTIIYDIAEEDASNFRALMRIMRERRLRDGARRWRLYHDAKDPERFLELFRLDSWGEHLLQHQRTTMEDRELEAKVLSLHRGKERPLATHYFGDDE